MPMEMCRAASLSASRMRGMVCGLTCCVVPLNAQAGFDGAVLVENRGADAARVQVVLFIVDGVALGAHLFQFLEQTRQGGDGFGRALFHPALAQNLLQLLLRNMGDNRLADAGGVHPHAASDPGVHADKTLGFNLLDVDGFRSIQNS